MPFIKKSSIEEVRARVNIYDIVSRYVNLRKCGSSYKGLSPFTNEKTPSFFVYPDKNFYYCFSTSQGGDIFQFIKIKENLNFNEAVEFIADRFSIPLQYEDNKGPVPNRSVRKELYEINEIAADYYSREFFGDSGQASAIRKYWTGERGFTLDDAKKLRIGFAPPSSDPLKKLLLSKKFSIEALRSCGLFFARDSDFRNFMPRFRGRLIIPISDSQGRPIAFTARKTEFTPSDISYEEGKYVNSPETDIFKKNSVLFNFDKAKEPAEKKRYFILVEGQIDTIRMYCSGFDNTVASQGTGAGAEHFSLMKRHADKVVLLFDGDSAGRKTALRVIPICIKAEIEPYIAALPEGEDPDSYLRKNTVESMRKIVENRRENAVSYAAKHALDEISNPSPTDKLAAMKRLFEMISPAKSQVILDDYLREISRHLLLDPLSVSADFKKWKRGQESKGQQAESSPSQTKTGELSGGGMLTNAVYDALFVCLHYDNVAEALSQIISDAWISDDSTESAALKKILALHREGIGFSLSELNEYFDDESQKNLIYKLSSADKSIIENPVKYANDCIQKIYNKYVGEEIRELNKRLSESDKNSSEQFTILKRISELRRESRLAPTLSEVS